MTRCSGTLLFAMSLVFVLAACDDSDNGDLLCEPACETAQCEICVDGQCVSTCAQDQVCVEAICINLTDDCDPACDTTNCEVCVEGQCVSGCSAEQVCDEGACVSASPAMNRVDTPPQLGSSDGFPGEAFLVEGAEIHLVHDGELFYVYMTANVDGWISVGFNSQGGGMNGANMIIGYLDNGAPAYRNDVAVGRSHSEINAPAVVDFVFSVDSGTTTMAFSYPLSFPPDEGFALDGLSPGETYTMIVALHNSSHDISSVHSISGSVDFTVY